MEYTGDIGKFEDYPDLELSKAISVIERIHKDYDGRIPASSLDKLWGIEPRGGAFANRVKDVAAYGLIEGKGEYTLSKLGTRIVENPNDREAWAEAFLHVPLFKAIHDHFKGKLPENNELFAERLRILTNARKPSDASLRAPRLRNHYNEALPYLTGEPVKSSGSRSLGTSLSQPYSGSGIAIPQDYERLVGTDFVIATKKDLEAIEMLQAQVEPWITALKKKLEKTAKPTLVVE